LWELANDDGNLSTGAVQKTASTSLSLVNATNALLANLSYAGPNLYTLGVYQVDRSLSPTAGQDYIAVSQAPLPAPLGLGLSGLGLVGALSRRRKARA